jgi:hypothetical protein
MTMTENSEADGEGIERRAVLTALVGATALGSVETATAQENSSTPTATEEDTVAIELGSVRIKSWEHTGEEFRITFGADYPSAIKITDTGAMMGAMTTGSGSGITEIPTRGATVKDGMTMTYAAEEFDGAYAIAVASSDGAALIRTDSVDAGSTTVKLGTAMGGGLAAAIGAGGLSYKQGKKELEEEDEPNAERIV